MCGTGAPVCGTNDPKPISNHFGIGSVFQIWSLIHQVVEQQQVFQFTTHAGVVNDQCGAAAVLHLQRLAITSSSLAGATL
jgi:hypothetical protein